MLHAHSSNQLGLLGMDLAKATCFSRSTSHQSISLFFHELDIATSPNDTVMTVSLHKLSNSGGQVCAIDIQNFEATVSGPVAPGIGIVYDSVADEVKTRCFNEISSLMGMKQVDTCEVRIVVTWHSAEVARVVVNSLHRSVHLWATSLYDWQVDAGAPGHAAIPGDAMSGMPSDDIPSDDIMSEVLLRINASVGVGK